MCSGVIFQYKCGCAERVVFECPFSSPSPSPSPSPSASEANTSLRALSHHNCVRRYRVHQQNLLPPSENGRGAATAIPRGSKASDSIGNGAAGDHGVAGATASFPDSGSARLPSNSASQPLNMRFLGGLRSTCPEQGAGSGGGLPVTEIDECCHDCWQSDVLRELEEGKASEDYEMEVDGDLDFDMDADTDVDESCETPRVLRELTLSEINALPTAEPMTTTVSSAMSSSSENLARNSMRRS
ncbi:hypothetical protein F4808DRAFT_127865 [Astrocystis sublimbata]|nr:hypothetical protein F4808DRAFT_127865 [Astrocystis sublimbata]